MPHFVLEFTQPDGSHELASCEWHPWVEQPSYRTLFEHDHRSEVVEGFKQYLRAFLESEKAPATIWVALWANLFTEPGGIHSKVMGSELYGGPQTILPASIAFEIADLAGLDWSDDVVGRITFAELLELAKRNGTKRQHSPSKPRPKRKTDKEQRRSETGSSVDACVAAIADHHRYGSDDELKLEPIGVTELAERLGIAKSTASGFFKSKFGGHGNYRKACYDYGTLKKSLELLCGDVAPSMLFMKLGRKAAEIQAKEPDEIDD